MTNNELAVLADQIKMDLFRRNNSRDAWVAATLDLCQHLAQARGKFSDNRKFSVWLDDNGLGDNMLSPHDRAAAVAMGEHLDVAKTVLERTERSSLQLIHREEFSIASVSNTEKATATKADGSPRKRAGRKPSSEPKEAKVKREKGTFRKPLSDEDEARLVVDLFENNMTRVDAAKKYGIVEAHVRRIQDREVGRRQTLADPPIDASTLSKSAQEKLEAVKRQWQKTWEREKEGLIRAEALRLIEEHLLPHYKEKFERAERIDKMLHNRKGLITEADYKKILSCLHPDNSASERKRHEAFQVFNELKDFLVIDKTTVASVGPTTFPKTFEEMMAMRDAMTAQRKADYAASRSKNGPRPH